LWQCPGCGRSFRIPAGAESPRLCPECVAGEETVALKRPAETTSGSAAAAPPNTEQLPPPASIAAASAPDAPPAEIASIAESLRSIATHLDSVSRSLRTVRRIVWGVLISSVLSVLIYGYAAIFLVQSFSGGGGALEELQRQLSGASGGAGSEGGPNPFESLQRLQQETQRAQQFLREAEGR
jgi:hypothetical protein